MSALLAVPSRFRSPIRAGRTRIRPRWWMATVLVGMAGVETLLDGARRAVVGDGVRLRRASLATVGVVMLSGAANPVEAPRFTTPPCAVRDESERLVD